MGSDKDEDGDGASTSASSDLPTFDIGSKLAELKQTRQLGSQITNKVMEVIKLWPGNTKPRVLALLFLNYLTTYIMLSYIHSQISKYRTTSRIGFC